MSVENPWHDVSIGKKSPEVINTIIEIPKDSKIKYELDKETGMLKLDRFLYSAVHYPGDYGFVPQTLWDDHDPLDIIVLTNRSVYPMTLACVRVIGVIRMIDSDEKDDKIIGVYDTDPRFDEYQDLKDIPQHILKELKYFFEKYKQLQGKTCEVPQILGKAHAVKDVERAQKMYQDKYGKKE
jgi:inorganic pyrophosphatase